MRGVFRRGVDVCGRFPEEVARAGTVAVGKVVPYESSSWRERGALHGGGGFWCCPGGRVVIPGGLWCYLGGLLVSIGGAFDVI